MKAWNILYRWKLQKLWRAILTQHWAFTTVTLQFLWGLYILNWQPVQPYINKRTLDPNSFFFHVKIFCKQTLSTIFGDFAWKYWNRVIAHFLVYIIYNFYNDAKNTFLLIFLCYTQNYFTSFIIETHHIIVESSIPEQAS